MRTQDFPEYPLEETEENVKKFQNKKKVIHFYDFVESTGFDDLNKGYKERQNALEKIARHYHLKLRYAPVKGYEYKEGRFSKRERSKNTNSDLEEKVAAGFIGIISFAIIFIAFSKIRLTGYAVAENLTYSNNLMSIVPPRNHTL